MSEDKTTTKDKATEENAEVEVTEEKKTQKMKKKEESAKVKDEKDASLGLEELPDDIKKKLEKKQAEIKQRSKKGKVVRKKKKEKRNVAKGQAFIKSTYNNTIVTLTDTEGNVLSWASAGVAGFKGPKKSTPYAAQIITRIAVGKAREDYGLKEVEVFVRGIGTGRESAIRALNNNGLLVTNIKDVTPVPHNGCRIRRPRRV